MADLLGIDKAGKDAVDEAAKDLAPLIDALPAEAKPVIDYLISQLKTVLVGRTITITIK